MRILFAADLKPDPNSGAAGTEYQTILALRELGHEVDCIWYDDLPHRIRHWNLHYLLELPRAYRDAIAARCARNAYDVIHVNQPYAWLAAKEHRVSGRPGVFVNRSHGWEPCVTEALAPWRRKYRQPEWRFPRGMLGRPMRLLLEGLYPRLAARWSDGIIVSSTYDRDWICRHYALPQERVAVIPQAPAAVFVATPAPPMTAERLCRVLYVGQFAFVKAPHIVAEVYSRLAQEHPDLSLTWCCAEPDHAKARALLSPVARERVRFVGWMPQEQLVKLYDEHGIFLFPSFYEGFGKAALEAMARGLCVVASEVGGMKDVVVDGGTGRLGRMGDAGQCVEYMASLWRDMPRAGAMADAAAASARRYTWARVARELAGFYASQDLRCPR